MRGELIRARVVARAERGLLAAGETRFAAAMLADTVAEAALTLAAAGARETAWCVARRLLAEVWSRGGRRCTRRA